MIPDLIPFAIQVLTAINLYDQTFVQTHKIKHITLKRMLPTKLDSGDLSTAQALPQATFGIGSVAPQVAPELAVVDGSVRLPFHDGMLPNPHPSPPLEGEGVLCVRHFWPSRH